MVFAIFFLQFHHSLVFFPIKSNPFFVLLYFFTLQDFFRLIFFNFILQHLISKMFSFLVDSRSKFNGLRV